MLNGIGISEYYILNVNVFQYGFVPVTAKLVENH